MRSRPPAGALGVLIAVAVLGLSGCGPDSVLPDPAPTASPWTLVNPRPFAVHVTDLWGPSPDRMFAVGLYGGLLVREGERWRAAPPPTSSHLWDVHGCDWQHVWAVSEEGLLRFDGRHWRREGPADLSPLARVFANGPDDVMLATPGRASYHWDGRAWTRQELDLVPDNRAGEWLAGGPGGRYLAVGRDGAWAVWEDGRWRVARWEDAGTDDFQAAVSLAAADGRWFAAVEQQGGVLVVALLGDTWVEHATYLNAYLADLAAADAVYTAVHQLWRGLVVHGEGRREVTVPELPTAAIAAFPGPGEEDAALVLGGSYGTLMAGTIGDGELAAQSSTLRFAAAGHHVWPDGDFAAWDWDGRVLVHDSGTFRVADLHEQSIWSVWGAGPDTVYAACGPNVRVIEPDGRLRTLVHADDTAFYSVWGTGGQDLWLGAYADTWHGDGRQWTRTPWTLGGGGVRWITADGDGSVHAMTEAALGRWDGDGWRDVSPPGTVTCHGLAHDRATGDLLVIVRTVADGPRTVMRRHAGAWTDLGYPGITPTKVIPGPDGEVRVVTYAGLRVHRGGAWQDVPKPVDLGPDDTWYSAGGDPTGGIYVTLGNGGLYHLDLGGLGLWR